MGKPPACGPAVTFPTRLRYSPRTPFGRALSVGRAHPDRKAEQVLANPTPPPPPDNERRLTARKTERLSSANPLTRAAAGWKTAALLALLAIMAATAFGGVLSTIRTAEAQTTVNFRAAREPGDEFWVEAGASSATLAASHIMVWEIESVGNAKATFVFNGQTRMICPNGVYSPANVPQPGNCDEEGSAGTFSAKVRIAADSGSGQIIVRPRLLGRSDWFFAVVFPVDGTKAAASLTVTPAKTAIPASGTGNSTTLAVALKDTQNRDKTSNVTLTTTLGTITCPSKPIAQVCEAAANSTFKLTASTPGVATVTAKVGSLTATTKVTFYGTATTITAVPDASAIQVGDKTFVVVTVTDAGGNPVVRTFAAGDVTVAGPTTSATKVTTKLNVPKEVGTADGDFADAGELPHCDATTPTTPAAVTTPANYLAGGTNAAMGKCVIEVMAPKTPTMAARGNHMVTVKLNATTSVTATIRVSGAPNSIKTDAPTSVDALSSTNVAVTVHDDADMPVGSVPLQVDQISGEGKVTVAPTMTKDGKATFTYVAPLDGMAVFRIAAGTGAEQVTEVVRINIGAMADDDDMGDDDDMTGKTWNKTPSAATPLLVWVGPDGAEPSTGAVEGVVAIWKRTAAGWQGYFPEAAGAGLPSGLTALENGEAYWVVVR